MHDVKAGTISGGKLLAIFTLAKEDSRLVDLRPFDIGMIQAETVTVTIETSNGTNDTIAALVWVEEQ